MDTVVGPRYLWALALLLVSLPVRAGAQSADAPPPGWSAKTEVSFVAATGNSDTQTLGVGGEVEHRPDGRDELLRVTFVRSAQDGELRTQSLAGLLRVSQTLSPRTEVFTDVDYLRNRFAGIIDRYDLDAGVSYRILAMPSPHLLRIFASVGYLRETRVASPARSAPTLLGGLRYRWRLGDRGEIVDELEVTDVLVAGHDWRTAQNLSVTSNLTSVVSLKVSQRIDYLHKPVPGFRSLDTLTSAALVVQF